MAGLASLSDRAIRTAILFALENGGTEDYWNKLLGPVLDSKQDTETYGAVGAVRPLRKKSGGNEHAKPSAYTFSLTNEEYEASTYVTLKEKRQDKTQQVQMRINQLGARAQEHWGDLGVALMNAAASTQIWDGQYFFDTDHQSKNSGVQNNSITYDAATPALPTPGEMESAILKAVEKLISFKDDEGVPNNKAARKFLVLVPLHFMTATASALGSQVIIDAAGTGGRTNRIMTVGSMGGFTFDMAFDPTLNWTDKFALFRTDGATTPLIRQEEVKPILMSQAEGSAAEYEEGIHKYKVETTRAAGYQDWTQGVLTTFV